MIKILNRIVIILFAQFLFHTAGFGNVGEAARYLEDNVVFTNLSNGISVIMLNRGYAPTLSMIISFRVGSVDEGYRSIGTAHMLEHMLFKGTDRIGTNDFKKENEILKKIEIIGERLDRLRIESSGDERIGDLEKQLKDLQREHSRYVVSSPYDRVYTANGGVGFNASTSRDRTAYYIELPAVKLELWARLESERLRNPVLREYYIERDAVMEERLMRYESRGNSNLFEKFIAVAFLAHPYRHPTIGWKSNIEHLSIKSVRGFYDAYYIPSRMTITVVGLQDTDRTLKLLEKYFGRIEKRDEPQGVHLDEPLQRGERRLEIYFESNPYLLIGWHKPTSPSRDDYVADIISGILSDGKTSRFYRSLVLEKGIAASVESWNGTPGVRYNNLFIISAVPKHPHTPDELEVAIYKEIERLRDDINRDEIERVLNRIESSMVFDLDSNSGIARSLSYYQTVLGDWGYLLEYLKTVKTISLEEIRKTIDKFFTKENRTVGILRNSALNRESH
ncbi:MAG: pitrilysin family protein [Spirochaetota bacterium]|nr:pitrilysin family protein [Spirochaetota bacterium]